MFIRAHMRAALLVAAVVLVGCSDYGLHNDLFTSPSRGSSGNLRLSKDSVMLHVGKGVILSATRRNGGRQTTADPIEWQTSDTSVAVVNDSGKVQAVGPGTATVTATVGGESATSTVTVSASPSVPTAPTAPTPPTTSAGPGVTPELPRVTVDVSMPTGTGHSLQLNATGDLQAAINAASPGDQILLPAGATFTGNFTLPVKSGTGWVVIRTTGTLPSPGTRVHPSDAAQMARIVAADPTAPVFRTAAGAHNYRLIGLEMTAPAGATQGYTLVALGDGSSAQNTVAQMAHDLVLDRVYVHGTPTLDFQRCISLNSGSTAIVDSYISECHAKGMDSQAIAGWNGSGPYRIENNYLEGAAENLLFGGADPAIQGMLPRDITVRRNYFFKPLAWNRALHPTTGWEVKNLLEFKIGQRVLIEGNVFENNWEDAQGGTALLFKSVNQGNTAPWSETSDVTVRYNIIRNVANGVSLAAQPEPYPVVGASRILFEQNVFDRIGTGDFPGGKLFQVEGVDGLTLSHNTAVSSHSGMYLVGTKDPDEHLTVVDNIFAGSYYGIIGEASGSGTVGLTARAPGWTFRGNIVTGANAADYPANNQYLGSTVSVGFANYSVGNYSLSGWSPTSPGANFSAVQSETSGVTH